MKSLLEITIVTTLGICLGILLALHHHHVGKDRVLEIGPDMRINYKEI